MNPNSLHQALGAAADPHPDADLLAAFTENALLPPEREHVLAHLAACPQCRSVTALASDSADAAVPVAHASHVRRPILRIAVPAAIAAAAVLVSIVVIQRVQQPAREQAFNLQHTPAPVPQQAAAVQSPVSNAPKTAVNADRSSHNATATKHLETNRIPPAPPQKPKVEAQAIAPAVAPSFNAEEVVQMEAAAPIHPQSVATPAAAPPPMRASAASSLRRATPAPPPATAPAAAFANSIVTPQGLANVSAESMVRPRWRLNAQGQPERAFSSGIWQAMLPNSTRMRVISTEGREVWVGGDNTQLYRSADNGATWTPIALPEKSGRAHTITHIRLESPATISIESSDGLIWTSMDGGATWK